MNVDPTKDIGGLLRLFKTNTNNMTPITVMNDIGLTGSVGPDNEKLSMVYTLNIRIIVSITTLSISIRPLY